MNKLLWIVQVLLALFFLFAGGSKLAMPAEQLTQQSTMSAGFLRFIATMSPMPRMGEAHELDAALLFLAGSGSTFMTGQSLIVDGGWTAR